MPTVVLWLLLLSGTADSVYPSPPLCCLQAIPTPTPPLYPVEILAGLPQAASQDGTGPSCNGGGDSPYLAPHALWSQAHHSGDGVLQRGHLGNRVASG